MNLRFLLLLAIYNERREDAESRDVDQVGRGRKGRRIAGSSSWASRSQPLNRNRLDRLAEPGLPTTLVDPSH